jgi:hypothetical protein
MKRRWRGRERKKDGGKERVRDRETKKECHRKIL